MVTITKTNSQISRDPDEWDEIFNTLVKMLRTQQNQLEYLVDERKNLENRIRTQHERWMADIRLHEDTISQLKSMLVTRELEHSLDVARLNYVVGLKNRDVSLCEIKLAAAEDERSDFKAWFEYLTQFPNDDSSKNSKNTSKSNAGDENSPSKAETEVRRLRIKYDNLALEKKSEISVLSRENSFLANQFKQMENELSCKLKSKDAELEEANKINARLISRTKQLESSNHEKEERIVRLQSKVNDMEADLVKKNEEISRLVSEVDSVRESRSGSVQPVLRHCRSEPTANGFIGKHRSGDVLVMKEFMSADIADRLKETEKGTQRSKRKRVVADFADSQVTHPSKRR